MYQSHLADELAPSTRVYDADYVDEVSEKLIGLLLWALYHHQGGSSPVGQPVRRALGIDAHARLTEKQVTLAKQAAGSFAI